MKVEFSVGTKYIYSEVNEIVDIDISDCETQEEIDNLINELFKEWLWENIETYWEIQED